MKINQTQWLIMSKDRKLVAKGTPRNRELILVSDTKDRKRFLTYSSKKKAEAGFKGNGFYGMHLLEGYSWEMDHADFLEAVEFSVTYKEVL